MFPDSNFLYVRCLLVRNCIRLKVDCEYVWGLFGNIFNFLRVLIRFVEMISVTVGLMVRKSSDHIISCLTLLNHAHLISFLFC